MELQPRGDRRLKFSGPSEQILHSLSLQPLGISQWLTPPQSVMPLSEIKGFPVKSNDRRRNQTESLKVFTSSREVPAAGWFSTAESNHVAKANRRS